VGTTDGWYVLDLGWYDPAGLVPENAWTHLAMTYDGSNFKLYKNGQLIKLHAGYRQCGHRTGKLLCRQHVAGLITAAGNIAELRLWGRALSQSEIQANMNRKLAGNRNGVKRLLPVSTNTTKDMTNHGNDGILLYKESFVPKSVSPR